MDIIELRNDMEAIVYWYGKGYDSEHNPIFENEETKTLYYSLQTELRKLVNTKR